MQEKKILAAKIPILPVALATSLLISSLQPVQAGIPVVDGTNLTQNIMSAIEAVAQTLKQIQEYQTQLQQYENQLQNTMAPAAHIWDQAQRTINDLNQATNTLAYYQNQLGSLDAYLGKFQGRGLLPQLAVLLIGGVQRCRTGRDGREPPPGV